MAELLPQPYGTDGTGKALWSGQCYGFRSGDNAQLGRGLSRAPLGSGFERPTAGQVWPRGVLIRRA